MRTLHYKKNLPFVLLIIMSFGHAFGQSTNISGQEDSQLIHQFVENSRSIMDSLIRYEFAKQRITLYKQTSSQCEARAKQLREGSTILAIQLKNQIAETSKMMKQKEQYQTKYKRANRERWVYRIALLGSVYVVLRSVVVP